MKLLGSTQQGCPYCGVVLQRMPKRKTKCKECGNFIYVRTRPQDREKVLLRESELVELEEQWLHDAESKPLIVPRPPEVLEQVREQLTQQFGRPPRHNDVLWRIFNLELLESSSNGGWAVYAGVNFEMGEVIMSEGKYAAALHQYLIAFVLWINGPRNIDPQLVKSGVSRFSGNGFCPPPVIKRIRWMLKLTDSTYDDIKDKFFAIAEDMQRTLILPRDPESVWEEFLTINRAD
jgi:hypothetical protein